MHHDQNVGAVHVQLPFHCLLHMQCKATFIHGICDSMRSWKRGVCILPETARPKSLSLLVYNFASSII